MRTGRDIIAELLEAGIYTAEAILSELLVWLPTLDVDAFVQTGFRGEIRLLLEEMEDELG